ncbi:MAG: hypothetical protein EB148_06150 [Actinobacteria bacterium]|nr:hypothetical protein [Actinomycetota bacterium]
MKIEILRSVVISGEPVQAGSILEVSDADANLLIGMNKAQLAPAEPEPEPAPQPVCEVSKRGRKPQPTPDSEEN